MRLLPGYFKRSASRSGGVAIHTRTAASGSTTNVLHYVLKDHLGSTHLLTDDLGAIVQAQSFDAFGMRRQDDDYLALTPATGLRVVSLTY